MLLYKSSNRAVLAALLLLLGDQSYGTATTTSTITTSSLSTAPSPTSSFYGTCEARTINYITHTLPSMCLKNRTATTTASTPTDATSSISPGANTAPSETGTATDPSSGLEALPTVESSIPDEELGALDDASFLSFEDWKKQTQDPVGQDDRRRKDGAQETLEHGDDGEIHVDFGAFLGDRKPPASANEVESNNQQKPAQDTGVGEFATPIYRGKDVGKTCKERFNFASLDAGGQVMKANTEAKSISALLSENRDVYLLNICSAKNKFLIIELSESILVETVALANFEFFSSTFRQFRISVSDKYPQKLDRWVELGVFEARNSRDVQAFLVENPRIWARYLRIEFMNHYGNEFYCPVSLLRVHGETMIQNVLNMEKAARGEIEGDDDDEEEEEEEEEQSVEEVSGEIIAQLIKDAATAAETEKPVETPVAYITHVQGDADDAANSETANAIEPVTPWHPTDLRYPYLFATEATAKICAASEAPIIPSSTANENDSVPIATPLKSAEDMLLNFTDVISGVSTAVKSSVSSSVSTAQPTATAAATLNLTETPSKIRKSVASFSSSVSTAISDAVTPSNKTTSTSTSASTSVGTSTAHHAQPTTQESFFKTVSKRLQLLEANSSLSLKYIEEQSKILREAFTKVEKRQLSKTTLFLENLNSTVLAELRGFGEQYDQIWQSTVIELETQKHLNMKEMEAVTKRLNILADELVFQKRMSIVQSVLLLLCLCLVVFSRVFGGVDVPGFQNMISASRSRNMSPTQELESPDNSPIYKRNGNRETSRLRPWGGDESGHMRTVSYDSTGYMRSPSAETSPPTPFSTYSATMGEDGKVYDVDNHDERNLGGYMRAGGTPPASILLNGRSTKRNARDLGDDDGDVYGVADRDSRFNWQEGDAIPEQAFRPSQGSPPRQHLLRHVSNSPGLRMASIPNIDIQEFGDGPYSPENADTTGYHPEQTHARPVTARTRTKESAIGLAVSTDDMDNAVSQINHFGRTSPLPDIPQSPASPQNSQAFQSRREHIDAMASDTRNGNVVPSNAELRMPTPDSNMAPTGHIYAAEALDPRVSKDPVGSNTQRPGSPQTQESPISSPSSPASPATPASPISTRSPTFGTTTMMSTSSPRPHATQAPHTSPYASHSRQGSSTHIRKTSSTSLPSPPPERVESLGALARNFDQKETERREAELIANKEKREKRGIGITRKPLPKLPAEG